MIVWAPVPTVTGAPRARSQVQSGRVHVGSDGAVVNAAEDWNPDSWQVVTDELARMMSWTGPILPDPRDPGPFVGTKAS